MSESNENNKGADMASNPAPCSAFRGYKKIDFEVFWNQNDRITIRQGYTNIQIHPGAIGYLYGMLKDVRDEMEDQDLEWREVD